jgi:hypothetical protein
MSVLILHRKPLAAFPYDRWLAGYPGDVVMLAARDQIVAGGEDVPAGNLGYTRLELLDDFEDEDLVCKRGMELAAEFAVSHVVASTELVVLPAAWLRERLGLPGPWTGDVLPFRDKALMKQRLRQAGIEIARYAAPRTAQDARAFAARHGFPVVFKPRDGSNSTGLAIVRDEGELAGYLARAYANGPRDDLLSEAFIAGRMCHVDGLVHDNRVVVAWPSQYQYSLATFGADPGARVDLTLDSDDPLTGRLLSLTERVLSALRPATGGRMPGHAFHAEIFHTTDDRLVLSEVACRPAGAKVPDVMELLFGLNLHEYSIRSQVGLPMPALEEIPRTEGRAVPACMAGQVLMMKRPGLVRSLPGAPAEPWVSKFWMYAAPGEVISPATGSADFLLAAVASAPTRVECEGRLRALGARFEEQVVIEQAP